MKNKSPRLANEIIGNYTTISSSGKDFQCVEEMIPYNLLDGDPKNPRYSFQITYSKVELTSNDLRKYLKKDKKTKLLKESIRANGGLAEAIYVRKVGEKYIVKEGNRRWTAYGLLAEEEPGSDRWEKMRVCIIPQEMSDAEFHIWLSNVHGMGKIDWDNFAKALYYKGMHDIHKVTMEQVAINWGKSVADCVDHFTTANSVIDYSKITEDDCANEKFWHLYEWVKLGKGVREDQEVKEKIFQCIRDGKFKQSKQVREVSKIANCPAALEALVQGTGPESYNAALEILSLEDPSLSRRALAKSLKKCHQQIGNDLSSIVDAIKEKDVIVIAHYKALIKQIIDIATYTKKMDFITDTLPDR